MRKVDMTELRTVEAGADFDFSKIIFQFTDGEVGGHTLKIGYGNFSITFSEGKIIAINDHELAGIFGFIKAWKDFFASSPIGIR